MERDGDVAAGVVIEFVGLERGAFVGVEGGAQDHMTGHVELDVARGLAAFTLEVADDLVGILIARRPDDGAIGFDIEDADARDIADVQDQPASDGGDALAPR